jgi:hypothetical protein
MPIALRNHGGLPFLVLRGHFVVRPGQMPDGDTVSFVAAQPYVAERVTTNVPVAGDGNKPVNVRLQSIDAPEKTQPLGAWSRDQLLGWLGFKPALLGLSEHDFTVNGAEVRAKGWLFTHGLDGNRRPLGYVMKTEPGLAHGSEVPASSLQPLLRRTGNHAQAQKGAAFPAFYDNTDEAHALVFQAAARRAREAGRGVWPLDRSTSGFTPTPKALGVGGTLVYPKVYRRVADWTNAKPDAAAFIAWLKTRSDGKKLVVGAQRAPTAFWKLFEAQGSRKVALPYDVLKLWWSE